MAIHSQAQDAAPRVYYEWQMLEFGYNRLCEDLLDQQSTEDPVVHSLDHSAGNDDIADFAAESSGGGDPNIAAVFESFLLHVRVLSEFLTKERSNDRVRPDDIVAGDYFEDGTWSPLALRSDDYLEAHRERLHKSLAHLSYQRIQYEHNKQWRIGRLFSTVKTRWDHFWKALPDDRKQWFKPSIYRPDVD